MKDLGGECGLEKSRGGITPGSSSAEDSVKKRLTFGGSAGMVRSLEKSTRRESSPWLKKNHPSNYSRQ